MNKNIDFTIEELYILLQNKSWNKLLMYEKENRKLEEAEEILSNLVLNLIQAQVLTRKSIKTLNSLSKIENFWTDLAKQNDSVSLIDKKLRMQLISEDIFLLLEKIITKIQ